MLDFTPPSVALQIGPVSVFWYGICYALGLALAGWVINREAKWRDLRTDYLPNGIIVIAIAAVIGGRLYHVIDQWQLYKDDPLKIVLPPYTGLGAYGGIIVGTIVGILYIRYKREPVLKWADAIAPGLFAMQFVARWGNFFNQELYGPPTDLPWGIPIECARRLPEYPCSAQGATAAALGVFPFDVTRFHPLFLYESLSGLLGMLFLIWLGRRYWSRLRPGDLLLVFFIWYSAVRFWLETFRSNNWTFFGVPTAQVVAAAFIVASAAILMWRHRPGAAAAERADGGGYDHGPDGRPQPDEEATDEDEVRAVAPEADAPRADARPSAAADPPAASDGPRPGPGQDAAVGDVRAADQRAPDILQPEAGPPA